MSSNPRLQARQPIAVLLSRFPVVTETFILREIIEMERQGQPVRLVPLFRESPSVVHPEAQPWIQKALYTPFLSAPILLSNLRVAFNRPVLYFGLLIRLVFSSLLHPRFLLGTMGIFLKSVYLAARLADEGVRHVHCHFGSHPATAALIISAFSEVTFSVTIHAHDLFVSRYTPFLGLKLQAASFIRVISEFNRRYLLDRYPAVVPDKVHVIHVGIPIGAYEPGRAGEGGGERTRILSVAGLRPYKGLSTLVGACHRLKDDGFDFQCTIVGEGPLRNTLQRQIEGAGLSDRVQLAGAMTQGEVAKQLRGHPIFTLPSVVLRDGMMDGIPVALMEAMAAGAPAVASRISGIPELIEDGESGILVDPGDSSALAESIRRIARDPTLARSLAEGGARKVRARFSLDACTRQLLGLIDRENPPIADPLPAATVWRRHIRDTFDGQVERDDCPYGVRILHEGRDSRVVEVLPTNHGKGGSLVVKVHVDRPGQSRPASERARHEYEVMAFLTSTWRKGSEGENGSGPVPRPTGLDQEAGLLVMETSHGRRLDGFFRAARSGGRPSQEAAVAAVERTGEWLRHFQELTAPSVDPLVALEAWEAELRDNLQRSAEILPVPLWARAESSIKSFGAPAPDRWMTPSGHHGDFWPGNVLVTPDGAQVLDFEGYRPGVAHEDPAYFLLQSEFFFDFPLLRRRFPPLRSAFLRGYGDESLPGSKSYRACRMSVCLRLLAMEAVGHNGAPAPARRRRIHRLQLALDAVVP